MLTRYYQQEISNSSGGFPHHVTYLQIVKKIAFSENPRLRMEIQWIRYLQFG